MLDELSQLQDSDEDYWLTSMNFTVETRSSDDGEIVHKEYTFTWGEEFDQWNFSEYEERRCDETDRITDRNWRTSRHVWWHESDPIDVDVPQIVSNKLAERLGCDEVKIQL